MKKSFFNIALSTLAMTSCGNVFTHQTEVVTEKVQTEIVADTTIQLTKPDKTLNASLMQALTDRQSRREFSEKQLSLEDLSSLLWAANGINREDGRRTAPSAVNAQDIDIYVCLAAGTYLYDAKLNQLKLVTSEDLRPAVAGHQAISAPVFLLLVADLSRYPEGIASRRLHAESLACMDAGYVSGNIGLYCSAAHLATVPRAMMDKETLTKALNLKETQIALLNNPIGYIK